ncbi:1028_t:CDS:2, partial [Cetraspora pellucida]
EIDRLISKCKSLISILSKEKKWKQLCEAQLQITPGLKEPLDIIKDVDTRWNFTFYSIECLVSLKPAIIQLYSTLNNHTVREIRRGVKTMSSFLSSEDEFELLNELIVILSPFNEAMQFLSGSEYPTLGFMTPMLEELTHRLRQFTRQSYKAILVKDMILNNLVEHWGDPKSTNVPDKFDQYCEIPEISLEEESCPLIWWHQNKTLFPTLAILARRYLAVPASFVPSE